MLTINRRNLSLLALATFFSSCAAQRDSGQPPEHMELGDVSRAVIDNPQYPWFDSTYNAYEPQAEMLEDLNPQLDSVRFLVVFGTWCSDSRREVPRFFRIMDLLNVPKDHIALYGVDRSKKSPGIPQQFDITSVPTIIVLRDGTEIGRIVEAPKTRLEFDVMEILTARQH